MSGVSRWIAARRNWRSCAPDRPGRRWRIESRSDSVFDRCTHRTQPCQARRQARRRPSRRPRSRRRAALWIPESLVLLLPI